MNRPMFSRRHQGEVMIIRISLIAYCFATTAAVSMLAARTAPAQTDQAVARAQAVALEKQAESWLGVPKKWSKLARSLERAAEIRGPDDPRAVRDLMMAAAARVSAHNHLAARTAFTQGAEWALGLGDVENAANGYMRASLMSIELKDFASARALRDKAERLARSPLLTEGQRAAILGHFVEAGSE
jgi:hypothetical protein